MQPKCELHLARDWDAAWRELLRPWLAAPPALRRDFVLVPTRGQAAALKQRCVREDLPLLGVEFLTPGLARQKWLALAAADAARGSPLRRPALGRELLLLGLRLLIERRLAPLRPEDPRWGLWKSLQSDAERALNDFDELLKAGFATADFPTPALREIFGELVAWAGALGYTLAPWQAEAAALTPVPAGAPRLGGRLLLTGFGAEAWGEFANLAALARRCADVTVILPEPELRGQESPDENWIELWTALLGVEARLIDAPSSSANCAAVGALWTGGGGSAARARVIVGQTRTDEMTLVADEIARLAGAGAENVAVVFPRADAAHLRLAQLLAERGVPFADLLETAGPPPIDAQLQRGLLEFYECGTRLEELLALWPLLRALNFVQPPLGVVRDICERLFDESQTHALAAYRDRLLGDTRAERREVARIAELLLPAWPAELTLADALQRFEAVARRFNLEPPASWPALAAFATRETRPLPAKVIFATLAEFLPAKVPADDTPGRGRFAPVTLTTRRRAAGLAWSHVIFVESNAGIWPARETASCWLTDEQRRELNVRGRFSLGLFTSEDRAALEKQGLIALARDTREQVIFSAALFDAEEPELRLAPNAWLERVLLAQTPAAGGGLEEVFFALAQGSAVKTGAVAPAEWTAEWRRRRDPAAPFDEYFLSGPPETTRPARLAARQIERGVQDPAELWFEAVLGARRVDWAPLARARKKSLGQLTHRLLAEAMRGQPAEGIFMVKPSPVEARARLREALAALRTKWPRDRYWDSLHGELGELCVVLLEKVAGLRAGDFVAVEAKLPEGATIPLGGGERQVVHGRMDLVLLDRPGWGGATVDIVDFKTGADAKLSAERMARGASLQLGVYLAAVKSLGIAGGRVWMLKPEAGLDAALELGELPAALAALAQLQRHLATGCYGALTPDRTEFSHGFEWPLACAPVPHAVLARKFAATFGLESAPADEEAADE
ncbi:MAG: PD-(D/E)XK nuclease family protein [Opitutae bacterium]|nr:PD-(D/E)XK nuclease family protein [Opitutae bacterium]